MLNTESSLSPFKEKAVLFLLAILQFTHIVDFMIMMPLGPQLMRVFNIGPSSFSTLVSAYTISAGVVGFLAAFFLDRFNRKHTLIFVYCGFIVGTIGCGLSDSYAMLMTARIFTGAFGGMLSATVLSIVGDLIPAERRAYAMGIVTTAFSLASVLGVPAGLYLAGISGWSFPFLVVGGFSLLIVILCVQIIPEMKGHLKKKRDSPWIIITAVSSNPNLWKVLLTTLLLMLGQFSIIPFISPYMVSNVGFTESQLPLIYFFGGLLTLVTMPMMGKLADRYGKFKVFSRALVISIVPILLLTHLQPVPVFAALCITTLFMITVGGRSVPLQAMASLAVEPSGRGSFMSFNGAVQQLSAGIAAMIAGSVIQKSQGGPLLHFEWIGVLAAICSLLALKMARQLRDAGGNPF